MYKKILVCLDNSDYSLRAARLALSIAAKNNASVIACHVYAARLHNVRFRQMEEGLPDEYKRPEKLDEQRKTHETLITKGLGIISDTYISVFSAMADEHGITPVPLSLEGKNFEEIVKEANSGGYDLVVMGAFGLGKTDNSRVGSVAERVARRAFGPDLLIVKDEDPQASIDGRVLACIDGSSKSYGALSSAIEFSDALGLECRAVGSYDPGFHYSAFKSIAGVLSDEAGKVFKFKEQEALHEDVIDKGLERIYKKHLDKAMRLSVKLGTTVSSALLSGKAWDSINAYAQKEGAFIIALGRTGVHASTGLDIGSTTENILREAKCNVLISNRVAEPLSDTSLKWNEDALEKLSRVPELARTFVRDTIEGSAEREGIETITPEFMDKVRSSIFE